MPAPLDASEKFAEYAHPEKLVSTEWLAAHLDDPSVVVVESDEDVLLYETGHIPGAVKVDWHADLNDPTVRDYLDPEAFARLMSVKGIAPDSTVVFYGDNFNWWAAYALWVFSLFGHRDLRLLDGGRQKWVTEGRPMTTEPTPRTPTEYPVPTATTRRFARSWRTRSNTRRPESRWSTSGLLRSSGASVCTCPTTRTRVPSGAATSRERATCRGSGLRTTTGRSRAPTNSGRSISEEQGIDPDDDVVAYCRIGERSSHTWFVLTHLFGYPKVRNYDGSWTEYGNAVRVPIEK